MFTVDRWTALHTTVGDCTLDILPGFLLREGSVQRGERRERRGRERRERREKRERKGERRGGERGGERRGRRGGKEGEELVKSEEVAMATPTL